MKKKILIMLLLFVFVVSMPMAYANPNKTLKESLDDMSIAGIASIPANAVTFVVKTTVKILCAPFYWMEQVAK